MGKLSEALREKFNGLVSRLPKFIFAITLGCAALFMSPVFIKGFNTYKANVFDSVWYCAKVLILVNVSILVIYILYHLWGKINRWLRR